jgi:hypothetical protein
MNRMVSVTGILAISALVAAGSAISAGQTKAQETIDSGLAISVSEEELTKLTGEEFTFTSTITNEAEEETTPLIASLGFVATDGSTYVDPEDWSEDRTQHIRPIDAGKSVTLTWGVKTVLEGDVAAYVAVLPAPPELSPSSPLAVSAAIQMHVEEDRKLNPGGVLPTVLAVPAVLAAAFAGLRVVRRVVGE